MSRVQHRDRLLRRIERHRRIIARGESALQESGCLMTRRERTDWHAAIGRSRRVVHDFTERLDER